MLSDKLRNAMNEHLNNELYSAYQYLAMAAHFEGENFPGFASWMHAQAKEEYGHAMKFWQFIYDREGRVELLAIDQPPQSFKSPLDVFRQALDQERKVTQLINELYTTATDATDYASQVFLQWFIQEQVEEERTAAQIVDTLETVGDSSASLLLLDRELGQRGAGTPATG